MPFRFYFFNRLQTKLVISFSVLILLAGGILGYVIYKSSENLVIYSIGTQAKMLAERAHDRMDVSEFEKVLKQVQKNPTDEAHQKQIMEMPEYQELQSQLMKIKDTNGLKFLYTMAEKAPGKYMYIVDGQPANSEDFSPPGEVETNPYPELKQIFETKQTQIGELTNDAEYGATITAYVPLHDQAGNMIGIVGADFDASQIYAQMNQNRSNLRVVTIFMLLVAIILCFWFAHVLVAPLHQLSKRVRQIRQNGLENIDPDSFFVSKDEVGELAIAFKETLASLIQELETRRQMEQSLVLAKEEAEKASQAKSDFLSRMSHELRTPMNAILGFAQLLEYNTQEPLTENQQDSIHEILSAGNHLLALINEVLDLARIESGRLSISIEPVFVLEVLQECETLMQPIAEQFQIQLDFKLDREEQGPIVQADRLRLKQVLLNVLSNSIKYNKEQGSVAVWLERILSINQGDQQNFTGGSGSETRLHIHIKYTGIGIPDSEIEKIFEPFHRVPSNQLEIEGTGIGLAVVKQLMELMRGSIHVESQVGQGSHFWIELPILEATDSAGKVSECNSDQKTTFQNVNKDAQDMHSFSEPITRSIQTATHVVQPITHSILYIEDNPTNLNLVTQILAKYANVQLFTAVTGSLGLDLARAHQPDLILLDMNLPDLDGLKVLKKLQSFKETTDIPVIMLSANALPRDIKKAMNAGAKQYLTKPIQISEFTQVLKLTLGISDQD